MNKTVRERILENLFVILKGLESLKTVQRWNMHGNDFRQVPCLILSTGPEVKIPGPSPLMTCRLTVFLDLWVNQMSQDNRATDTIINELFGEIEETIMVDETIGELAVDILVKDASPFETVEGQPFAGLSIEIEVHYRHQITDPKVCG